LLATGGTAAAAIELVQKVELKVVECFFLIELKSLNGSKKLNSFPFYSLLKYE
jgi:adenine phosphoribosyltransferase